MTISNYKLKSIGACIIAIMALNNDGLCQSCRVIDIDNVETTILPGEKSEDEKSEDDNSTSSYKKIPPFTKPEKDKLRQVIKPIPFVIYLTDEANGIVKGYKDTVKIIFAQGSSVKDRCNAVKLIGNDLKKIQNPKKMWDSNF